MDWWVNVIIPFVTLLLGGGIATLVTLGSTRRKANAEADNAAVEPLKNAIEILNQQLNNAKATIAEKEEKIAVLQAEKEDKIARLTALYDDMCIHKGCKLRKPHQGMGQKWYEDHADDPTLGCDYLSVETLLKQWRKRNSEESVCD